MLHRNLPLKAASLLLAIFLWFWVLLNVENPILEVPVEVQVVAEGVGQTLDLGRELPEVQVRVRALKRAMDEVRGSLEAYVSCQELPAGNHLLPVKVRAPDDVTVVSVRSAEIPVILEEVVSQARSVEVELTGDPPPGYELGGYRVSPKRIEVSGPRSRVERAARVRATMDLSNATSDVAVALPVRALDSGGGPVDGLTLSPPRANVQVSLKLVVAPRTVPVVVTTSGQLSPGLMVTSVQVEPSLVTILGPAARVQEVTRIETEPLPLTRVRGSFSRTLALLVPDGVTLMGDPGVKVMVKVEKEAPAPPAPESPEEPATEEPPASGE